MLIIDADTHADETEETWSFLEPGEKHLEPMTLSPARAGGSEASIKGYNRYWAIDGQMRVRRVRDDVRTGTIQGVRELTDIPARLRQMDDLGVDIQVIYPSLFLSQVSARAETEVALCKAYNRWMAQKFALGGGRLRWVAPLPLLTMSAALEELEFVAENGACGILKKGRECGGRLPSDSYFFPLYRAAEVANMPICIHLGTGDPNFTDADPRAFDSMLVLTMPVLEAFHGLITNKTACQFDDLRFGFIETSGSWLPFMIKELKRCADRMDWMKSFQLETDLLQKHRLYIACDTYDDLPELVSLAGDSNLVIGSDFGHADMASEIDALARLRQMADEGCLCKESSRKILSSNPAKFYGLESVEL